MRQESFCNDGFYYWGSIRSGPLGRYWASGSGSPIKLPAAKMNEFLLDDDIHALAISIVQSERETGKAEQKIGIVYPRMTVWHN